MVSVGEQVYGSNAKPSSRRRVQEVVDASGLGLGQLHYQVHVNGFWQVHPLAPTTLVHEVVGQGLAGMDNPKTLELYSGAGLFTLPLSLLGAQVTASGRLPAGGALMGAVTCMTRGLAWCTLMLTLRQ